MSDITIADISTAVREAIEYGLVNQQLSTDEIKANMQTVTPETKMDTFGFDSADYAGMSVMLEEKFGQPVSVDKLLAEDISTVAKFEKALANVLNVRQSISSAETETVKIDPEAITDTVKPGAETVVTSKSALQQTGRTHNA